MTEAEKVQIVRTNATHLEAIAELESLCFAEPWSRQSLSLLLGDVAVGYTALADGKVVAYGGMLTVPGEGQITNIAVHPAYRKKGIGRAVLAALIQEAEQRKLDQIALEVRTSNTAAIKLYEQAGFVKAGCRKNFYKKPIEDAWIMLKS